MFAMLGAGPSDSNIRIASGTVGSGAVDADDDVVLEDDEVGECGRVSGKLCACAAAPACDSNPDVLDELLVDEKPDV